jgi:UDP-glucuronate 4-epimerase
MRIFVTGAAGFIGYHAASRLLGDGHEIMGFDGFTDYYDVSLKRRRNEALLRHAGYHLVAGMLEDKTALQRAIDGFEPEIVVHFAAQAGVRYSAEHPGAYASSNVVGTLNLLEALRRRPPQHLLFASTSSVYGGNPAYQFRESDRTDFPVSLYAATKKAGEAMTHAYAGLYAIPTTCFRFFTVYGPWGRPDMALFKFVRAIHAGEPIEVYGEGRMRRDFTYVDDLVEAIVRLMSVIPGQTQAASPASNDSLSPAAPWRVVNIAGGKPVALLEFIEIIEQHMGSKAEKIMLPMQPGDVESTFADPALLKALTGYVPATPLHVGVGQFIDWYFRDQQVRRQVA